MDGTLALSAEEMRALGYRVIDRLVEHLSTLADQPAGRKGAPGDLRERFSGPAPVAGTDFPALLARLDRDLFPFQMNLAHPRFFAFVPGPASFISALADMLAAGFNTFNGSWLGGSGAAALELQTIGWLRDWCGLPESVGGQFVPGGSLANLAALAAARHARLGTDLTGARIYCSDQTHSSIDKALLLLGFAPGQIRRLPAGARFRLPVEVLAEAIAGDRAAGLRPFCVIANAGTTSTGAVDPLPEIAALCRAERLWLHIDGAYGAAAVISEPGRRLLAGLEHADSLSLDPHKWLFQTIECGCVLLRDRALLHEAFCTHAGYLRDIHRDSAEVNPCDYGIQLTRGFRALKFWLSVQYYGLDRFRAAVSRGFALAELAEAHLRTLPGWEIVSPATMGIVAFRYPAGDAEFHHALVEDLLTDGYGFLSSTVLGGETALRLCAINPETTDHDVRSTLDRLHAFATRKAPQR